MKIILGIDPGHTGAIAMLDTESNKLIEVIDMPILEDGTSGRKRVNAALLASLIGKTKASHAYVEHTQAMPRDSSVSAFSFGRSRGVIEGVLASAGIATTFIAPAVWKRCVGIPAGKDGAKDKARSIAISKWPDKAELFARKRDDGRAEAGLVAVAGMQKGGGDV